MERFSIHPKILRTMAWVLRFTNCRKIHATGKQELSTKEITAAELLCKLVQKESLSGINNPQLQNLNVFEEKKVTQKNDNLQPTRLISGAP